MRKNFKLPIIIATILALLCFSGCRIIEGSSRNGDIETYSVNINTQPASEDGYSSLVDMLDAVRPSVVEIYVSSSTAVGTGAGSGIIISKQDMNAGTVDTADDYTNYFILTCHHVIDGTDSIVVKDIDGNQFNVGLIGGDPESDIAVLKTSIAKNVTSNLAVATVRDIKSQTAPLKVGEDVVAIGNPLGSLGGTVTKGIVSAISRTVNVEGQDMELLQTDCSINSGNSGGGLFDMQGKLVGVVNAGYTGLQGLNFAIPVDDAMDIFESLVETYFYENQLNYNFGYVPGRVRVNAENAYALSFGYDIAFGDYSTNMFNYYTFVMGVKQGSVYEKAGFKVGDYVTAVSFEGENREVKGAVSASLVSYLDSLELEIGDKIIFTVNRNGTLKTLPVTYKQFIYGDTGCVKPTE